MSSKEEKQYGLILPKKHQVSAPKAGNVFGDDNASDEEDGTDWVKKALKAEGEKHKMKRQTKLNMQKALEEDPTIYQYDEVYDDMERVKSQTKTAKIIEKKPKYIENLLKAAERRKKEQEHRIERMVQKEREAEGEMFAGKESFVTSAYRAKLEEFKKMEEEDARMDRLESIGDVTKQQDLSGFYRHFYEQTVDKSADSGTNDKADNNSDTDHISVDKNDDEGNTTVFNKKGRSKTEEDPNSAKTKKCRQYRKRVSNTDESDSETDVKSTAGDTNKKIVSSDGKDIYQTDVHEPDKKKKKQLLEVTNINQSVNIPISVAKEQNKAGAEKKPDGQQTLESLEQDSEKSITENDKENEKEEDTIENKEKRVEKRDKSLIWKKRTVGAVLEAALQRYYARKAASVSGS